MRTFRGKAYKVSSLFAPKEFLKLYQHKTIVVIDNPII